MVNSKKLIAFVVMAISEAYPELEDVLNTIKKACGHFDIDAIRIDEIEHPYRITDLLLRALKNSDLVVADISYERPNVYYEIGYAHGIEQQIILIAKTGQPLHFDIKDYKVIFYKNMIELEASLKQRLRAINFKILKEEIEPEKVTICTNCANFMNKVPGSTIWYNHYCAANPLPRKIDPYDGKLKAHCVNDLGGGYFTDDDEGFMHCRDINKGACSKYEPVNSSKT
jgi:nucleoside 2-deoxyribosyltransferase